MITPAVSPRSHGLNTAAQALVCLLLAATLCSLVAGWWWVFDLFVHFRPQYLVAALLLAAVLFVLRNTRWMLAALALALINLIPIVPLFQKSAKADPPLPPAVLHVMSFNVLESNERHELLLEAVRRESPDVLVLLEVSPEWAQALAPLKERYPFEWVHPGNHASGIAVFSRIPPRSYSVVHLIYNSPPSLLLDLDVNEQPLSILATHLSWPLRGGLAYRRNRQLASIARLAREHAGALAVIGDLNITPFSPHFQQTLRDGGLHSCVPGMGFTPTWPTVFPPLFMQIDHCLGNAALAAGNFRVGSYLGSDHYPIFVTLAPLTSVAGTSSP